MPFDGTGYEGRVRTLEKMDKVIHLLSDERRWCQGFLKTPDGRYCILGAIQAARAIDVVEPIMFAISEVTGRLRWIDTFNDHPRTTHADVVTMLKRARENIATGATHKMRPDVSRWPRLGRFFSATKTCGALGRRESRSWSGTQDRNP
jgi:hypothetical protein